MNKPKFVNLIQSHKILAELRYGEPIVYVINYSYKFTERQLQSILKRGIKVNWPPNEKFTYEIWYII